MTNLILRILINAAALIAASLVVPGIHLPKASGPRDLVTIGAIALIFALINSFLKPIVKLLSLPITLVTLGLVGLFINAAMLLVLAWVCGQLDLGFTISGFPPKFSFDALVAAFAAGIIVSIVAAILGMFFDRSR